MSQSGNYSSLINDFRQKRSTYMAMNQEERDSQVGRSLLQQISDLDRQLKEEEASKRRHGSADTWLYGQPVGSYIPAHDPEYIQRSPNLTIDISPVIIDTPLGDTSLDNMTRHQEELYSRLHAKVEATTARIVEWCLQQTAGITLEEAVATNRISCIIDSDPTHFKEFRLDGHFPPGEKVTNPGQLLCSIQLIFPEARLDVSPEVGHKLTQAVHLDVKTPLPGGVPPELLQDKEV